SMFVLGWGSGKEGSLIEKVTDSAIGPIASVVLITGAGGMFGGVLRVTGIGDAVAGSLNDIGMPVIVAAYLIAQIVRLAQGSATVALTTAASLMVGVIAASDVSQLQIVAIVMAMSAGSVGFSHVNDSGFWLVSRFFGMDMKQTLATWTVIQGAMALIGFVLDLASVRRGAPAVAAPPCLAGRCGAGRRAGARVSGGGHVPGADHASRTSSLAAASRPDPASPARPSRTRSAGTAARPRRRSPPPRWWRCARRYPGPRRPSAAPAAPTAADRRSATAGRPHSAREAADRGERPGAGSSVLAATP